MSASESATNPWAAPAGTSADGHYADVNGVRLYYELHGAGRPLVLLHGGLGAGSMFGPNVAALAKGRQVVLVDLQGHGRTADVDRPLTLEAMADDISALIAYLKLGEVDVMGYSLGGGVALHTAVRHPDQVRKLILVSAAIRSDSYYPDIRAQQKLLSGAAAAQRKGTPMFALY